MATILAQWLACLALNVLLLSPTADAREETALLELSLNHFVKPIVKPGDGINYTIKVLHQKETSQLEATGITVEILLPIFTRFAKSTSSSATANQYSTKVDDSNRASFHIASLPLGEEVAIRFEATISDPDLTSGLHYASTPITLRYQTRFENGSISQFPTNISTVAQVPLVIGGCHHPLGISNGDIKFYQFSGSTTQVDLKPYKARYNGKDDAWCAHLDDKNPYIQVLLNKRSKITGISTWGRKSKNLWVKKYTMEFSQDGESWLAYGENGYTKQFGGNFDKYTEVHHWFIEPFEANYVRLFPVQWSVGACMRFELYGCAKSKKANCINPLGMEKGKIPATSFSTKQTPSKGTQISKNFSRLNQIVKPFPYGWCPDYNQEDWLEIDLGSNFQITAIAVQGAYGADYYVKKFSVRYKKSSDVWKTITDKNGAEKKFPGIGEGSGIGGIDIVYFTPPIIGRYLRVLVGGNDFQVIPSMRMEWYGCLMEPHYQEDKEPDTPTLSRRSVYVDAQSNTIFVCIYTDDQSKSICKRSNDGKLWKSLNPRIMGIIFQGRVSRHLYGVDRNFHKVMSNDGGETWYSISDEEWKRHVVDGSTSSLKNLEDILPSKKEPEDGGAWTPDSPLTWQANNGHKWGISGDGVHMKGPGKEQWELIARWKCCGM